MNTVDLTNKTLDCFKSIMNFGSTTYQNICGGENQLVQWGMVSWVFMIFIVLLLIGLAFTIYKASTI
jgi:hypothetical protein